MKQKVSELRKDLVSGDWVVIATGRAKRPHAFIKKEKTLSQPKESCPFENPEATGHTTKLTYVDAKGNWSVKVIENKYPAFSRGKCTEIQRKEGLYQAKEGTGYHEVVITRDHEKSMAQFTTSEVNDVLRAYKSRYNVLKKMPCIQYISIFHNHGLRSGATISHPHSQIIAIPVIPPDINKSFKGSSRYYKKHGQCVHCVMIAHEMRKKHRVIYENDYAVSISPYVPRTAFEIRVFPKIHQSNFEKISDEESQGFTDVFRESLFRLHKGLRDPDYNFFLHTAPIKNSSKYAFYHWHIEILPKTAVFAGFELSTGIEISSIEPKTAAEFLRNVKPS